MNDVWTLDRVKEFLCGKLKGKEKNVAVWSSEIFFLIVEIL